ncbi:MAG TPA: TetR/AcrR family transcriptional regulator [Holophagaceae bacterium]|nr:TetR/AcrR family transcriptional regulator [Holophagaceae bacterium]
MANEKRTSRSKGRPVATASGGAREALLDAAQELFGRQGIAATSLAKIAAQADMTPAMVHYYFSSRDQLLDALLEERIQPLIDRVWGPVPAQPEAVESILDGMIHRLVEGAAAKPWLPPLWVREVLSEGGLLRERMLKRLPVAKLGVLAAAVAKGQAEGRVNPDLHPPLLVMSVLGLSLLPLAMSGVWKQVPGLAGIPQDHIARHASALLRQGLQP